MHGYKEMASAAPAGLLGCMLLLVVAWGAAIGAGLADSTAEQAWDRWPPGRSGLGSALH